jgi:adenylate kinase
MSKVIWVGGPHGVGKSSVLKLASAQNPPLRYLYLGRLFFENAEKIGYKWEDLSDEKNLLIIEGIVTDILKKKFGKLDYLVDGHFAINFGGITYPGYHTQNLKGIFSTSGIKKGLINLTASPEVIIQRRNKSKKRFKAYLTKGDYDLIRMEIQESKKYFEYFYNSLNPNVSILELDTERLSLEEVAEKIGEFYHGL